MNIHSTPLCHDIWLKRLKNAQRRFPHVAQSRPEDSHKGTFGTLAIIGGQVGMSGALALATSSALYTGCGKVWAGFNQTNLPFAMIPNYPEIMLNTASQLLERSDIDSWAIGCGLGINEHAVKIIQKACQLQQPVLFDADALNLIASSTEYYTISDHIRIITPHPAEAARLLASDTAAIQQNRHFAAKSLAERFQAITVLKGSHTVIATPNGRIEINDSGNAGLATAGSGDVLSGIIGSLLAQNIPAFEAVTAGVWLHGAAAEWLAENSIGEIGLLAGEIAQTVRLIRNCLTQV